MADTTTPAGGVTEGYLLLGDISGYTEFLTSTELEHSHAIVTELTKLIRATLCPPMQFVKVEGDAVFCFAPHDAFPNGELLVELTESCYFDFTSRLLDMSRSTTCTCDACRAISCLDLKFVAHHGSFIVHRDDDGRVDLAGPDVILVHRLLKNTIVDTGGPESYAFFTDPCLTGPTGALELPRHTEAYDMFEPVSGGVQDLAAVAARRREEQVVRLTDDDADIVMSYTVDAPPAVCWQYLVEPGKRLRHVGAVETGIDIHPNADGRYGAGASSHCAHGENGDALREYLDWRPYDYFTCRVTPLPKPDGSVWKYAPKAIETYEFQPLDDGRRTLHRWMLQATDRSPEGMAAFEEAVSIARMLSDMPTWGDQMRDPVAEDAAVYGLG